MMNTVGALVTVLCVVLMVDRRVAGDSLPECKPEDFHFEYTECDSDGGRWRVSVPKKDMCKVSKGGAPSPPVRGKDCTFTCSAGQYLNLTGDQTCQPCPAGTYSLGGGVRFDDWDKLPETFSSTSEELGLGFLGGTHSQADSRNCSRAQWKPRGAYIFALPGPCTTTLTFSTKLVKAGIITFEYQYTDPETIFHFIIQNDQCQAADDENSSRWPDVTKEGSWGSMTLSLNSGTNILQWRVIGALSDMSGSQKPVLIRKIEVTGVAYTSECSKCRSGTYSSGGTAFCAPCAANEFSERGAAQCQACKEDEYSEPGSSSCWKRPPCTKYDYYEFQTPCDENNQTRKVYKWMEPQTCNPKAAASVGLPHSTDLESCPPCNPGMYLVNTSYCDFCAGGLYSDGSMECKACPVSTSPQYALDYQWWMSLLPNITTRCFSVGMAECAESAGWQPAGDHVYTSFSPSDRSSYLVLSLYVAGFRGQPSTTEGKVTSLSQVRFTFEISCEGPCEFTFLSDAGGRNKVIELWMGSMPKQEFVYDVHSNEPLTLSWAFQPVNYDLEEVVEGDDSSEDHQGGESRSSSRSKVTGLNNMAKIYAIKVSNVQHGGATGCLACPKGTTEKGCVPCPDGQYVDKTSAKCVDCPPDTVLPSGNSWGEESCKACGEGLKAVEKRFCKSDCRFTDSQGRQYDFTSLDGVHYVQGGRLFTAGGTMYYHGFNLTLCNAKNEELPICINNVTAESQLLNQASEVVGMMCRSTLIPQSDKEKRLVSTQPVSLASHLTKIVTNVSLADLYHAGGFQSEETEKDIHFYYKSQTPTLACPDGRTTIISLRCDPEEKSTSAIQLPPKCSDGTCDGCTFHFAWRTQHACPRCQREDYEVVRGECVNGEQLIHYYAPSFCVRLDAKDLKPMKQKCRMLPFAVMVAIPVTLAVGLILIILLIYCWSRNRKLEYKYSKLVETAGGQDGELPGVETCGMEEGEEEDAVHFTNSKGPRLLQKMRQKMRRSRSKDDSFAAVRMHEKLPLT
ncbi:endosome/lysosome-associated apoptosis and autophagy regulator family member 2-like [Babylonia areolata]|uniref:endosome/lysosome-associated apoptosis and autophagy regulator family member 2-like n=1 Tax=Babylonia areolata TaxID=304850 RepID=UPI003FD66786